MLKINTTFIDEKNLDYDQISEKLCSARKILHDKTGLGSDCLGWIDLYDNYDHEEFERIKNIAKKIRKESEAVIIIGVGGSYLGAKACICALKGEHYNDFKENDDPLIYFAGYNMNGENYYYLINMMKKKETSLIVISKSGKTLETAIGFRILRDEMEKKYKDSANDRIYVITDKEKGVLKDLALSNKYESFVVPDNIGGRYSVFTPVGLLPLAVAGIDIDMFYEGMHDGQLEYMLSDSRSNDACRYASSRYALHTNGKSVEILLSYNPRFSYIQEWWKQLFGESECKNGKGLIPVSMELTRDLHSLGQLLQDGNKIFFETTLINEKYDYDVVIPSSDNYDDGLDLILNRPISDINEMAYRGAKKAHVSGGVDNLEIRISSINERSIGKLLYFFMYSCALSAYMLEINPFDQPGVEEYKRNIKNIIKES